MEFGPNQDLSGGSILKLMSFLLWSLLYFYTASSYPGKSPEWCSRVVTVLHGSVAAVVGLMQCEMYDINASRLTMRMLPSHYLLMLWSWGYFAFDLLWCLVYWSESKIMLLHHSSALIGINLYMALSNPGCTFACTVALLEVTNPLLQLRWFLKDAGYGDRIIFYIVEVSYLTSFCLLRGVLGSYIVVLVLRSELFQLQQKIICITFYLVSLAFIYQMLGFVLYKYKTQIDEFRLILLEIEDTLNNQV